MTREEAIEEIKRWTPILLTSGQCTEETSKAQDMAILALSEELSEDGTLTVHVSDGSKVKRVFVMGDNIFGGLYYPDSAENKGDLISRQAVEKLIWEHLRKETDENIAFYEHFLELPSVESKGEWIPVSERLPENTDDVLVTDGVNMFVAWCIKNNGFWKSYDAKHDEYTPILAWQPLPEPYKAEREE